jgi:hypothetical protein
MAPQKPESTSTSPWAYVTRSPKRIAIAAAVIVGAIVVGAGIAFAVNGLRRDADVADLPSTTPTVTVSSTGTDGPMPTSSAPSITPTESPQASPEASESASPSPTTVGSDPTEAPSATPAPDNPNRLAGTWEPLPQAPDPGRAADAIRLSDGRIAVLMAKGRDDCIRIYSPDTDTWERAEAESLDRCFGSQAQFIPGTEGRYFGIARIVDASTDPWTVSDAPWEIDDGYAIGMTTDGRLWTVLGRCDPACGNRVFEIDPETGAMAKFAKAPSTVRENKVIAGPPSSTLFLGGNGLAYEPSPLVTYEPGSDTWTRQTAAPFEAHWERAKLTDDGWLWVPAFDTPEPELYARDPDTGEWLTVKPPPGLGYDWLPVFIDGADGRIYAMEPRHPYVFTPDGS